MKKNRKYWLHKGREEDYILTNNLKGYSFFPISMGFWNKATSIVDAGVEGYIKMNPEEIVFPISEKTVILLGGELYEGE